MLKRHAAMPDVVERGAAAARFEPAAVLEELARAGETFHGRG